MFNPRHQLVGKEPHKIVAEGHIRCARRATIVDEHGEGRSNLSGRVITRLSGCEVTCPTAMARAATSPTSAMTTGGLTGIG
jgi:hypothetical protein